MWYNTFTLKKRKNNVTDPPPIGRTFGYCRVSTRQQSERGHSLEDQRIRIGGYCQANGLPQVTEFYVDAATSGSTGLQRRQAGKRLLAEATAGDHICVTKGDRLFRSAKNALEIAEVLRERGVELHLMDMGGPVLNSSVSRLVFGILMMVANMEAERIGERTAAVKEHRRELGFYVGGPVPAGYVKTDDGRISKDAKWDANLKLMKEMAREGQSSRVIAAEMTSLRNVPMSHVTVLSILANERKVDTVVQ